MTTVVNIRYSVYDVYCGRPGKNQNGFYGNLHPIGFCKICNRTHDREDCIKEFKRDFEYRLENEPGYKEKILELKDMRLGCFCKNADGSGPKCHADVFKDYLDN